jgi:hypothetical protein
MEKDMTIDDKSGTDLKLDTVMDTQIDDKKSMLNYSLMLNGEIDMD